MKVILIGRDGNARAMQVERLPVRVAVHRTIKVAWDADTFDPSESLADIDEYDDTGLRDEHDIPVLTPKGVDVPLNRFAGRLYRLGRSLYADVWITELAIRESRHGEDFVWTAAQPSFRHLSRHADAFRQTHIVRLRERETPFDGRRLYRVFAKEVFVVQSASQTRMAR